MKVDPEQDDRLLIKLQILLQDISDYAKTFGSSKVAYPVFLGSPRTDATKDAKDYNGTIVKNSPTKAFITSNNATNFSRDSGSTIKEENRYR